MRVVITKIMKVMIIIVTQTRQYRRLSKRYNTGSNSYSTQSQSSRNKYKSMEVSAQTLINLET